MKKFREEENYFIFDSGLHTNKSKGINLDKQRKESVMVSFTCHGEPRPSARRFSGVFVGVFLGESHIRI